MALEQLVIRYFEEILQDKVNFLRLMLPELSDYNIGSRVRTMLESVSLEEDEIYHQIAVMALLWNLENVRGRDLDERLLEWNISRMAAMAASGYVTFSNSNLVYSFLASDIAAGAGSVVVLSSLGFPTSGFPIMIRLGEGTSQVEDVAVNANATSTGTLTLVGVTANDHLSGVRVSLVEGGALTVPVGTQVRVRSSLTNLNLTATTVEQATIAAGDYESDPIRVTMDTSGSIGNVTAGAIREFVGSAPFDGAEVRNEASFFGGTDEESDASYRSRGKKKLQSLSRGTPLSLRSLVVGIEYTDINGVEWRVRSAQEKEFFEGSGNDWVYLYIWPGSFDFVETTVTTSAETLTSSAEEGQKFFRLAHNAVVPDSLVLQYQANGTATWTTLTKGINYYVNEGVGDIRIIDPTLSSRTGAVVNVGLSKGDGLRALQYRYYTGLIQTVQSFVNGVAENRSVFPGVSSAGIKALVTYPRAKKINDIRLAIQVNDGYKESDVAPLVQQAINRYLLELGVGDDLVLAEMIERAMGVEGMYNVSFSYPDQSLITLLEDEILDLEDLDIFVS